MNSRGFTVIELLIATAIFSLILTGLTIALMQQQKQSNLTQEAIDLDQTARATLDYIASEIRNSTSRQGKTFSLRFINGGSQPTGCDTENTGDAGSEDSPPDCLTIYTWDITRGQNGNNLPSIPGNISVVSAGPPLVLQLPSEWFPAGESPLIEDGDLLSFRSRIELCDPAGADCEANPDQCTECAAILRVETVDSVTKQATIADNVTDSIIQQNFQDSDFATMADFINNAFISGIASLASDMTIVASKSFTVDTTKKQLEILQNEAGNAQPIAGGDDAPGIVDLQFVFNLQTPKGGITKVGVPLDAGNCRFPDFDALEDEVAGDPNNPCFSNEKDIRTVEIYLVVRSRLKQPLIRGGSTPVQTIPAIGDVLQRNTDHASLGEGFMYRVFSTTIYVRNMAREEFG